MIDQLTSTPMTASSILIALLITDIDIYDNIQKINRTIISSTERFFVELFSCHHSLKPPYFCDTTNPRIE
jgi:hypothetical protein